MFSSACVLLVAMLLALTLEVSLLGGFASAFEVWIRINSSTN